jgi:hypothetical protein
MLVGRGIITKPASSSHSGSPLEVARDSPLPMTAPTRRLERRHTVSTSNGWDWCRHRLSYGRRHPSEPVDHRRTLFRPDHRNGHSQDRNVCVNVHFSSVLVAVDPRRLDSQASERDVRQCRSFPLRTSSRLGADPGRRVLEGRATSSLPTRTRSSRYPYQEAFAIPKIFCHRLGLVVLCCS